MSALRRITDIKIPSFDSNVAHSFSAVRTIGQENRRRLEAIQLLIGIEPFTYSFDLPALMELDRQLCWFQDEFPNLKVVEIVIQLTALAEGLEQHFPRLKTRISLRWHTRYIPHNNYITTDRHCCRFRPQIIAALVCQNRAKQFARPRWTACTL